MTHRFSSSLWINLIMLQVLHYFSDVKYKNEAVLAEAFRLTVASLLHDKEPPVKVRRRKNSTVIFSFARINLLSQRWRLRSQFK